MLTVAGLVYFEVFIPGESFPLPGEEIFVDSIPVGLGGALNTASVAHALGVDTLLAHPHGIGVTDLAVESFTRGIGVKTLRWPGAKDGSISLVVSNKRDRAFISVADYAALRQCPALPGEGWIHVPGLQEAHELAPMLADARRRGAKVSVSGSWAPDLLHQLPTQSQPLWDQLVLNAKEAREAAGEAPRPDMFRTCALDVVITDGDTQITAILDDEAVEIQPGKIEVIDPTGAGDAFCAGLIAARLRGAPARAAISFAAQVAEKILGLKGGVVVDRSPFASLEVPK
jgi:ribokinase